MNETSVNSVQIATLIYRRGYDIVRMHSRHRGDPEIIRHVIDKWQDWVRYDRPRNSWPDLATCWNEFVEDTNSIRYTPPPCRICRGQRNFFATSCLKCLGRSPRTELVFLDKKHR